MKQESLLDLVDSRDRAVKLLKKASAHVYRQQHAGKHQQDRRDAVELSLEIDAFFRDLKG